MTRASTGTGRTILLGFVAGAVGVPFGHQLVLGLFHLAGLTERQPFDMTPTAPLGVPVWVSATFWGGVWGIPLALLLARSASPRGFWTTAFLFGLGPSLVTWTLVPLLKGQPLFGGGDPAFIGGSLVVNFVWSLVAGAVLWPAFGRRTAGVAGASAA
jgi:hypothetical protein